MKKLISTVLAIICAITCVCLLSACDDERTPYYNKTFTFTGEQSIDWNGKNFADNYGDLGEDVSQKQIIEQYWDKIDLSNNDLTAANADELISKIDGVKVFTDLQGLSLSFTDKDNLQLTVTMSAELKDWGYGDKITMPFAETQQKLNTIKPQGLDGYNIGEESLGYSGVGMKTEGDKTLVVYFSISYVSVYLEIASYSKTEYGWETKSVISTEMLKPELRDKDGQTVIKIAARPKYDLADNK